MKELDVAGYDTSTHKYATPYLSLKVGEKIKKVQEKEPEAAKEYVIYQLFYQSIEDGYSQSTNNDTNITEELEVEPEEGSTLNFHFARQVRQQGHCQAESCEMLL